jgi:hypothetical protein
MPLLEKPPLLFHYGGKKGGAKTPGKPHPEVLGRADTGSQDKTLVFNKDKKY